MGYAGLGEISDEELIEAIERRGFEVYSDEDIEDYEDLRDIRADAERLYMDYMLTGDEFFKKQLHKFFNDYVKGVTLK